MIRRKPVRSFQPRISRRKPQQNITGQWWRRGWGPPNNRLSGQAGRHANMQAQLCSQKKGLPPAKPPLFYMTSRGRP